MADWLHFEGRNVEQVRKMITTAREKFPQLPISVEIEKSRPGIETLFTGPDILLFSRHYALERGIQSAQALFDNVTSLLANEKIKPILVCTWGDEGAYAQENDNITHASAIAQGRIIDTIGAGDTFNAGFINACIEKDNINTALSRACELACKKCTQQGFSDLLDL